MTGTFGTLDRAEPVHRAPAPPQMPPPDECLPATRDSSPVARGDRRCSTGWTRGSTRRPPGSRSVARAGAASSGPGCGCATAASPTWPMLPFAVDALMPVSFDLGAPGGPRRWSSPGRCSADPPRGGCCAELTTDTVVGDLLVEDACRLGLHGPARRAVPAARRGAPAAGTSLLGCPTRAPPRPVAAVTRLAELPGIPEQVEAAREACTRLRWHQALRRRIPEAAAESRVRGAAASGELEGASVPGRRRARHRAGRVDLVCRARPGRGDDAGSARRDGRDRARALGGAHRAAAGARPAAHGGRQWAGRRLRRARSTADAG